MFIGNLLSKESSLDFCYRYQKRGQEVPYPPDMFKEEEDLACYGREGKLISGYVGYNAAGNLGGSVDILVDFKKECFVDSVTIRQFDKSADEHVLPEYENRWLKSVNRIFKGDCDNITKVEVFKPEETGYKLVGSIKAQTNSAISDGSITVFVGEYTDKVILRITANYKHLYLGKLEITGATDLEKSVFPVADTMEIGDCVLKNITGICAQDDCMMAAQNFQEKYKDLFSKEIPITKDGNICFEVTNSGEESYSICVTEKGASVKAGTSAMLLYASERLLQLCTKEGILKADIADKPFKPIRGIHVGIPSKHEVDFFKRLVKYVWMPMGYNTVFLQISGTMEYKRHPEINRAWKQACDDYKKGLVPMPPHYDFLSHDIWSQEEVAELCAFLRSYGLEVIPEVQSLGHTQYISMAYPEMAEPEKVDIENGTHVPGGRPSTFYYQSLCPNHPEYYNVIFDIIEEVVETVKPKEYVHIGHDEIWSLGNCEICRNIPLAELYAKEVTALHDKLKDMGLKTVMWSDMIQEDERYETASAIDVLPKDILCLSFIWYVHLHDGKNVEERLTQHGYKFLIGNMYSSHFPRYDTRKQNEAYMGGEVSTWIYCDEMFYAFHGKMYEFLYTANMLWSKDYKETMRLTYGELIKKEHTRMREYLRYGEYARYTKEEIAFPKEEKAVPFDMREDYQGAVRVGAGEQAEFSVSKTADRLTFLNAMELPETIYPFAEPEKVGEYVITYEDGTKESTDLWYGSNIFEYKRQYAKPLESVHYRHQGYSATYYSEPVEGKTAMGEAYTLYEHIWNNPHPEKKITSVTLSVSAQTDNHILLFNVCSHKKN